jgi:hypothetical protein
MPHESEVDDWVEKAVLDTSLPLIPLIDIVFPLELFCAGNSQGIMELLRE